MAKKRLAESLEDAFLNNINNPLWLWKLIYEGFYTDRVVETWVRV